MGIHRPSFSRRAMDSKRLFDFETLLIVSSIIFNVAALGSGLYLLLSLRDQQFERLTRGDVYIFIFLIGVLVASCVQYLIALILRSKRHYLEEGLSSERRQRIYDGESFRKILQGELRRAGRYHIPVTLCVVSLDDLEAIDRKQGHAYGDELLQSFAELVVGIIRSSDYLARYGRDEFYVLLCHTDLAHAENFLLRLLLQVQERLDMTFNAGLTSYRAGENGDSLLQRARRALLQARREGQRRIRCTIGKDDNCGIKEF